ncbi:SDR family NAD(P)-dependent oxidoreductase [Parashewanella spongiae]|uniref:SDR family NAD(P)-dependent oxidoreductase n=1 Tax=Parashewanella spongiae TaxID=342950 RepID=A0A3A6U1B4_9GAMM|nr:NAD-dependent epimerase/dehydratase family protein [Parashewanella spongiae]MCL1079779.1 SDR family NAD(P)-dependent oxidoreductase [Parashewanella spongiae]RJY06493.1 SDR family NAD(P)-dependent oxidoreductase [Parashewanella spongiae]
MKSVTIVGCGWFGLPMAVDLLNHDYSVKGSYRKSEKLPLLKNLGVKPFQLDLSERVKLQSFNDNELAIIREHLQSDYLIINIPPKLKHKNQNYLEKLNALKSLTNIDNYKRVIFISSTGVYPSLGMDMQEESACEHSESSTTLLQAEKLFLNYSNVCVVRFAGLIGPSRAPGRFLAGRKAVAGGNNPVNLVHLSDCIRAILAIISAEKVSPIYNLCTPHHPTKSDFYSKASMALSLPSPEFVSDNLPAKTVNGLRLCNELNFSYKYQNLYDAIKDTN